MKKHTPNPFTAEAVAAAASPLSELRFHNGCVYWVTRRPSEGGRQVVMEYNTLNQQTRCLLPEGYSAQSRVHEYGGGCYAIHAQFLFFVNASDQCMYQLTLSSLETRALTPEGARYGDITVSHNGEFLIAVREQHTEQGVANDLIRLDLATHAIETLASGADFYASPALNQDDSAVLFLSWSHPDMPWEKTTLWQLDFDSHKIECLIDANEAIYQPGFAPDNTLFYVSDRNGWWNLYCGPTSSDAEIEGNADCGYPMWVLGTNQVVFTDEKTWLICGAPGQQRIVSKDQALDLPFTDFQPTLAIDKQSNCLYFVAGRYDQPDALYQFNLTQNKLTCLAKSAEHAIDPAYFSQPQCIQMQQDGETVYGFYYAPMGKAADELPPMIVNSHGGPNGSATTQCQFKIQFWTSRGFAYLDVNYRGSTGYGRQFRQALAGKWGEADVDDCCKLALYCVKQKIADPARLFIRGQSAGGLTALSACVFHSVFAGGVSCYGVADLTTLIDDTHKFEARYLDKLVGPYPEKRDLYLARSPAYHLDQLTVPLLFLQGLEDRVVPVEQTKAMTNKLDASNKPYRYVEFSNEGHGFKRAENIIQAMEAELAFYTGASVGG